VTDENNIQTARAAEEEAIRARYARRAGEYGELGPYHPSRPDRLVSRHEKEREISRYFRFHYPGRIDQLRLLEIGCAMGETLHMFHAIGLNPGLTTGVDLLADHVKRARERLPAACSVFECDALLVPLPEGSFDIVVQSTVFSSILNGTVRSALARRMIALLAPGGVACWYDLAFDNPRNPDVRGIKKAEVQALFPGCDIQLRRMTLAPPISRRCSRLGYGVCRTLSRMPFLRSHILAWIRPSTSAMPP